MELFSLIPSLFLVQVFRRLRSHRKQISSFRQALNQVKSSLQGNEPDEKKKMKSPLKFPWWFIFIGYGLCAILVGISIFFIIARGIEFGDLKTQQWLTSILSGFFSSIILTQPVKTLCLAIFFAFFCRKSDDDNQLDLENDEEFLHLSQVVFFRSSIL
jgi:hypothetical protein